MHRALCFLVFSFFFLIGCRTIPPEIITDSPVETPESWSTVADHFETNSHVQDWSFGIQDESLNGWVEEGLHHNFNLQSAYARLDRAEALASISGASRWPSVNGTFRSSRNRRSQNLNGDFIGVHSNSFSSTVDLSWELDLWGKVRDSSQASIAQWQAAQEIYNGARLSLAANIAKSWVTLLESQLQFELAGKSLESFERNLAVVEGNFKRGISRALDYQLVKSNVASTRSSYERQKRVLDSNIRNFQALLGRYPDAVFEMNQSLPSVSETVPVGLPSELLLRRPDVLAAERQLAAASKSISVSKKALIPSIRLTGSIGTQSNELSNITNSDFSIWNLVGNLTQPIFNGNRLRANVKLAQANYDEALAKYGNTILTAFREVETYLATDRFYQTELSAREYSAGEAAKAAEMAWEEYVKGLSNVTTLLETQRRAFNAESSMLQTHAQRISARINLHLALGGSFDPEK